MEYKHNNRKKKFKFNKKHLIIVVVIIIIMVLALIRINHKTPDDGLKYNKNKSFTKTQTVKGIVFKNIKCTFDGKDSTISYTMINKTNKKIYLNKYDVIVKDKNNNRLTRISAHFTDTLDPNKSIDRVDKIVGTDLSDAYYMELKLNTDKNSDA